jgi:hypothetical protein
LDAAAQVFLENGYGGATIDLVIERAGASKATVYSATPRSSTPTSLLLSLTSRGATWRW